MAYSKGQELKDKIKKLSFCLFAVKAVRYAFFAYAFVSFLFWFLNCFQRFDWLYLFTPLFVLPYKAVHLLYKPSEIGVDFSLAIIGVISLLIGLSFENLLSGLFLKISDLKVQLEKVLAQKKAVKKKIAKPIAGGSREFPNRRGSGLDLMQQEDNIILIFIIHPHIHKIKTESGEAELSLPETESWRKRINKQILENLKNSQPVQKGYYRKNLFFAYKDFNYADDLTDIIRTAAASVISEFQAYGINVEFSYVLSAAVQMSSVEKELDLTDTILSLNFINKFILTASFKRAYEIKSTQKYTPVLKGEYNLSKNLSISNIQPLYVFKDAQNKEV